MRALPDSRYPWSPRGGYCSRRVLDVVPGFRVTSLVPIVRKPYRARLRNMTAPRGQAHSSATDRRANLPKAEGALRACPHLQHLRRGSGDCTGAFRRLGLNQRWRLPRKARAGARRPVLRCCRRLDNDWSILRRGPTLRPTTSACAWPASGCRRPRTHPASRTLVATCRSF